MAHGDKKWITAYDGKLKRSNDRTKKDYYRNLKWWEPMDTGRRYWGRQKGQFCPQCKHVQKYLIDERDRYWEVQRLLRARYDELFGDVLKQWNLYDLCGGDRWNAVERRWEFGVKKPKVPRPDSYYIWYKTQPEYIGYLWQYDTRSFLCWKCERKYEVKNSNEYWRSCYPRHHTWTRRQEYRDYRSAVKQTMNRAKYDEELYDDIPRHKKGWLD